MQATVDIVNLTMDTDAEEMVAPDVLTNLVDLIDGPYQGVLMMLDAFWLSRVDATCRRLQARNAVRRGPWCDLGRRIFQGWELDEEGAFEHLPTSCDSANGRKLARIDWKRRFVCFHKHLLTFAAPVDSREIRGISQADEVASFRGTLCTDVLQACCGHGVYWEVEVMANPDNLSMSVADFEAGGCSSVSFSPNVGAVIRERKVCEEPRKIQGSYVQPLSAIEPPGRFHGRIGLYLSEGKLAFFRMCASHAGSLEDCKAGKWETTGFVSDISWAQGHRLTPCIAFRDEGDYHVRVVRVGTQPPIEPSKRSLTEVQSNVSWNSFDWQAGPPHLGG